MRKRKPQKEDIFIGTLRVHRRGFGFVEAEGRKQDVFIPRSNLAGAVDGDQVEVLVHPQELSEKGPEGEIVSIVSRGRSHLAGTITNEGRAGRFFAFVPLLGSDYSVLCDPAHLSLEIGSRVVMHVDEWGDDRRLTLCSATSLIGHINDPSCDVAGACEEFQLRTRFSPRINSEVRRLGSRVKLNDMAQRKDLRGLPTVTIDPTSAKDFDDALSLSKDSKGNYHLTVHIADVSHYVKPGSALDDEAKLRCNSTYFPNRCIPMLPPALSNELCSLKPDVNRLAVSVAMTFDAQGALKNYHIDRTVIRSDHRFTYTEALEVLEGRRKSKHATMLRTMVELCDRLKSHRRARGSVEFALPEMSIQVDKKGKPAGTRLIEYDITHQMVEEFMLKANETIAVHLTKLNKGLAYRVHEEPSEANLKNFVQLASIFGYPLPGSPTPADIQSLFDKASEHPNGAFLTIAFIRSMKMAIYSPDNIGHYGLSLEHYCHFTSPIRRYADLVVHRVLFGNGYEEDQLSQITHRCSEQERLSARAEMSVLYLKKLRWLQHWYKQNPQKQWEGVISKVLPHGIAFELVELMLEGFIHISHLGDDYYLFDSQAMELSGEMSDETFSIGAPITVMLDRINLTVGEAHWHIARRSVGKKKRRKRR